MLTPLPIDEALPRLERALASTNTVVLSAPPGAGKTTRVPLALLGTEWMAGKKVIMLEPRRLAAQRAASYMAFQLGEDVGGTVGYRIRGDTKVGRSTRIEVVTEGILTRMLHADPGLPNVGIVIFDEFHERSIHADLGLALSLDVQTHLRGDLRILVMSATLDGLSVAKAIGDEIPIVESHGKNYPVETIYLSRPYTGFMEMEAATAVRQSLRVPEGDVLVFLPGQREIRRVETLLRKDELPASVDLHLLFGEAPPEMQHAALRPAPAGRRKVIIATSIAETSLTIDGVRIVVDSGFTRTAQFNPRRGMSGLVTTAVSVASADQRRGRAGRQAPGVCFRLWTEEHHATLPRYPTPEILTADLASLALDLARWGTREGRDLRFIDPPPPAHLQQARLLLASLGALDVQGAITPHGRALADLPVHPRLAHMIINGSGLGAGRDACDVAALLEERDILSGRRDRDVDLAPRLHALRHGRDVDRNVRLRILAESRRLCVLAGVKTSSPDDSRLGLLVALAYPERVARRRTDGGTHYQMVNGTGATIPEWSPLTREEFLAIADVDSAGTEARVYLAAALAREDILQAFADRVREEEDVFWNAAEETVIARRTQRLGAVILSEGAVKPAGDAIRDAMGNGIQQMGLNVLPWQADARSFRNRSEWLRNQGYVDSAWPDLSDAHLTMNVREWLGPFLNGITRRPQLSTLNMHEILRSMFSHAQLRELDRLAPDTLTAPTGSRIRIDYGSGAIPVLAVRLQEMFGQTSTPTIGGGKVPVLIHLLSPAGRPLAVTQDLRSFWTGPYAAVRKEMRGRYPKHVWPENPLEATPTRRTKDRPKRG